MFLPFPLRSSQLARTETENSRIPSQASRSRSAPISLGYVGVCNKAHFTASSNGCICMPSSCHKRLHLPHQQPPPPPSLERLVPGSGFWQDLITVAGHGLLTQNWHLSAPMHLDPILGISGPASIPTPNDAVYK